MKYQKNEQTVQAIYRNDGSKNPLIDAFPEAISPDEFRAQIACFPVIPVKNEALTHAERTRSLAQIQSVFSPLDYMYRVYDTLYRLMQSTYYTITSRETVVRTNALFTKDAVMNAYGTQPQSGALLGTPGIGKTTTIRKCLALLPQVIAHEEYLGQPFFCKQVLWLFCECPADASAKTMSYNIVRALDQAVGSNHLDYLYRMRSTASSAVVTYIKVLCLTYHVGVIVVDEVQNLVTQAQKTNRVKPLIRFLTELTNDSGTAVYMCGTTLAESVFTAEEYLRRRTRGPRLLPFKPGAVFREFLQSLWPYQYTEKKAELSDKLANCLYDYSGGIPAYLTKLFEEAQVQAIMDGAVKITADYVRKAADYLAIKPPSELGSGTFLNDFKLDHLIGERDDSKEKLESENEANPIENNSSKVKRLYSNTRGRKPAERETEDLICALKSGQLTEMLRANDLLEEVVPC